jgi:hypothetical protein
MVEVRLNQPESLLSRDQLQEVERFQSKFAELERQLHNCVDEFISVLNRHYFNRENGYLDEQVENLREIAKIQNKLEALAGNMTGGAGELKARMLELQRELQKQPGEQEPPPASKSESAAKSGKKTQNKKQPAQSAEDAQKGKATKSHALIGAEGEKLTDGSEAGGEISLKLVFEGMRLTDPTNAEALNQISSLLRKLLYERKLIGYSKTSLVFGKNRTIDEVLEDLTLIFLSESIKQLLAVLGLINPGEGDQLKLACNAKRELIFIRKR